MNHLAPHASETHTQDVEVRLHQHLALTCVFDVRLLICFLSVRQIPLGHADPSEWFCFLFCHVLFLVSVSFWAASSSLGSAHQFTFTCLFVLLPTSVPLVSWSGPELYLVPLSLYVQSSFPAGTIQFSRPFHPSGWSFTCFPFGTSHVY
jgi:hypothetical protein